MLLNFIINNKEIHLEEQDEELINRLLTGNILLKIVIVVAKFNFYSV